jgi:hypothetical protein
VGGRWWEVGQRRMFRTGRIRLMFWQGLEGGGGRENIVENGDGQQGRREKLNWEEVLQ